jgi:hypothetical protein
MISMSRTHTASTLGYQNHILLVLRPLLQKFWQGKKTKKAVISLRAACHSPSRIKGGLKGSKSSQHVESLAIL